MAKLPRRQFSLLGLTTVAAEVSFSTAAAVGASTMPDFSPQTMPPQAAAKQAVATLPHATLAYWDTESGREAVILMHPATGSMLVWGYQQPAFAQAGLRVIGYSRRGFHGSTQGDGQGTDSQDLADLAGHLNLKRFHLVSTAAGAFSALDFAITHGDRLLSLVLACSITGGDAVGTGPARDRLRPKGFETLPVSFQELSPSYRAANPDGMAQWESLQQQARVAGSAPRSGPPQQIPITAAQLHALSMPVLLLAGGSDLIAPPPLMRVLAKAIPGAQFAEIPDCGHSAYWEQPEEFNKIVLNFIKARQA